MPVTSGGQAGRDEPSERTLPNRGDVSGDKQADNIRPFELVAEQATAPCREPLLRPFHAE